jgi:hypothetical protein
MPAASHQQKCSDGETLDYWNKNKKLYEKLKKAGDKLNKHALDQLG